MADYDDDKIVCCAALTTIACVYLSRCKRQYAVAVWVKHYLRKREQYGVFSTLLPELATNDCLRWLQCHCLSVRKPKLVATMYHANSLSSSDASTWTSHNEGSLWTQFIKFSTLNTSDIAIMSVTASLQFRFLLVDCRGKSVRLLCPKFHCFKLAWKMFSTK